MQILVIGLNPAVDVEWRVASVHWDEKNVVLGERRWAGGKSVNVARWLRHLGAPVNDNYTSLPVASFQNVTKIEGR